MGREVAVWAVAAVWLAAVAGGFRQWERYDATPGPTGAASATESPRARWHLTVFAHPRCPCSRATLRELAAVADAHPELAVRVVFVRPARVRDGWERGESWGLAEQVRGANVVCDVNGTEARAHGAETSGLAVLTAPDGRAVFRGGLTPARGRAGDGPGRRAVLAWLTEGGGAAEAPVFGCPLFGPEG